MELNSNDVIEALVKAVEKSFETIAFSEITDMFVMDTFPVLNDWSFGASIDIIQPLDANFSLVLSKKHVQEIFDTVYGKEQGNSLLSDLIAELTNTIAGRFASAIVRKKERVKIGLPVSMEGIFHTSEIINPGNVVVVTFDFENYQVVCCLEKRDKSVDSENVFSVQQMKGDIPV